MDPNRKITKKFTKKFDSKVINRQYFHRKTGLEWLVMTWKIVFTYDHGICVCSTLTLDYYVQRVI